MSEDIVACHNPRVPVGLEANHAAKHPTVNRTIPTTKNDGVPNGNSVKAEKPSVRVMMK